MVFVATPEATSASRIDFSTNEVPRERTVRKILSSPHLRITARYPNQNRPAAGLGMSPLSSTVGAGNVQDLPPPVQPDPIPTPAANLAPPDTAIQRLNTAIARLEGKVNTWRIVGEAVKDAFEAESTTVFEEFRGRFDEFRGRFEGGEFIKRIFVSFRRTCRSSLSERADRSLLPLSDATDDDWRGGTETSLKIELDYAAVKRVLNWGIVV